MTVESSFMAKSQSNWSPLPDWVQELASIADQGGLKVAANRVGYSISAVSQVISNTYRGNLTRFEGCVRGALMGVMVMCPVDGEIGRDECLDNQAAPFAAAGSRAVALWRACKTCPHRQQKDAV